MSLKIQRNTFLVLTLVFALGFGIAVGAHLATASAYKGKLEACEERVARTERHYSRGLSELRGWQSLYNGLKEEWQKCKESCQGNLSR